MGIFYMVREKQEVIIESFGRYVKTVQEPGLKFKWPWPFQTVARRVPTNMLQDHADLSTKTKDDIFVTIPVKVHMQISDTKKFSYSSRDPFEQVRSRVTAVMKQLTSGMEFAELYQARETLSVHMQEKIGKEIEEMYGIKIVDVIVDEPQAPQEIQVAYNNVKASEREATAKINRAKADKEAAILQAEGRKEELRLDGEGVAEQRSAIFRNYAEQFNALASKGLTPEMAQQTILLAMANDTVRDAAKNGNVILTTNNPNEIISQVQALGERLMKPSGHDAPSLRSGKSGGTAQPG